MLSEVGGYELATTMCVKPAWKNFKELMHVPSFRHLTYKTRSRVFSSCIRHAMIHNSETWPLPRPHLHCLRRNDRAMIRQTCNVKPEDVAPVRLNELLARLEIEDLNVIQCEKRLCWFGHVERSSGAIMTVRDMQIEGKRELGRPKMTRERDRREWKLN